MAVIHTWAETLIVGYNYILKPIFHCEAKPFTLGPGVSLDPQHHNFALGIPTCWYLKALKCGLPPKQNIKFALPSTRAIVYRLCWDPQHVHYMLFVLISFALVTQRKPSLQWNICSHFNLLSMSIPKLSTLLHITSFRSLSSALAYYPML